MANMGYDDTGRGHSPPGGGMSERVHSPWTGDIDYDAGPVSISNLNEKYYFKDIVLINVLQAEEQMVDETDEQFEERVLNKRAYQMFLVVKQKFNAADTIILSDMCHRNRKKQVFYNFYITHVLTSRIVEIIKLLLIIHLKKTFALNLL